MNILPVSIIIPSYNRPDKLKQCISAIEKAIESSNCKPNQIIIVNDGSNCEYPSFDSSIEFYTIQNSGRAGARNFGVTKAYSEYLLFIDDDIQVFQDFFTVLFDIILRKLDVVTGFAEEPISEEFILAYRRYLSFKWTKNIPISTLHNQIPQSYITTQILLIKHPIFKDVGGFNEQLRDSEDYELGKRLIQSNVELYFFPSLGAFHVDEFSLRWYVKRQKQYQISRRKLIELNPQIGKREGVLTRLNKVFILFWPILLLIKNSKMQLLKNKFFFNVTDRIILSKVLQKK